jgi:SAM-dependent methyltransferase
VLYQNPALYDVLLPASGAHVGFYRSLAEQNPGGVLELACGSGQLLVPVARFCCGDTPQPEVSGACGLDLSRAMLQAAGRRSRAEGVAVDWREADMRSFELGRRFGCIFVARNSLLHLSTSEDFAACFARVREHLAPGGVFAFDIFRPDLAALARAPEERFFVMRVPSVEFGEVIVESTNDYDAASQVNRATWYISAPARQQAWVAPLHLRSIFPQELPLLLHQNGLQLLRRDGDLMGSPFSSTSGRQVCICQVR